MRDYQKLKEGLGSLIGDIKFSSDINLKLERITHLLQLIDEPHKNFSSIHIGGTSGKGSTSTMVSYVLSEASFKTGLHVSPYLQVVNEGFQINNQLVSSKQLLSLFNELEIFLDEVEANNPFGKPSYFETKVALAFYLFAKEKIDVGVVEVGLGGTLDATNVLTPEVAILTNVGLDHTNILGETIEEIIGDKVGIIKANQTVISGVIQPSARSIVRQKCKEVNATLLEYGQDFYAKVKSGSLQIHTPYMTIRNVEVGMLGQFHLRNAACAATGALAFAPKKISELDIQEGIKKAKIPGRLEIMQKDPLVVLDGAHNPDKVNALITSLKKLYGDKKWITVLAFKSDKDANSMLPLLIDQSNMIIATQFHDVPLWEAMNPDRIVDSVKQLSPIETYVDNEPLAALNRAFSFANKDTAILVTGSLYLVGNLRGFWYPIDKLLHDEGEK